MCEGNTEASRVKWDELRLFTGELLSSRVVQRRRIAADRTSLQVNSTLSLFEHHVFYACMTCIHVTVVVDTKSKNLSLKW